MSVSVNTTDTYGSNKAKRASARLLAELEQAAPPLLEPDFPWTVVAPPISFLRGLAISGPDQETNGYEGS